MAMPVALDCWELACHSVPGLQMEGKWSGLHSAVPLLTLELPLQLMFELQAYIFLFPHYTSSSLKY